jgi:hypothetical protein
VTGVEAMWGPGGGWLVARRCGPATMIRAQISGVSRVAAVDPMQRM